LGVPKTQNPKALALALSGLLKVQHLDAFRREHQVAWLFERLSALRSPGQQDWCWGYSFPWQGRKVLVPSGEPNLVCSTFVAESLLDLHDRGLDELPLRMAASAAHYVATELYWERGDAAGFSYPLPSVQGECHNANLMAAALLARVASLTGEDRWPDRVVKVTRHSVSKQHSDGSWFYGETKSQHWIDNFHTGYNLLALRAISKCLDTTEFEESIQRGFAFYRSHFLREDGAARYFHDRTYPIDIHCVAQTILTLLAFSDEDPSSARAAQQAFDWAVQKMRDERGFFYYRVLRTGTIRTSYMRWSQAWMFLACCALLAHSNPSGQARVADTAAALRVN
jgi:hypothetical protein